MLFRGSNINGLTQQWHGYVPALSHNSPPKWWHQRLDSLLNHARHGGWTQIRTRTQKLWGCPNNNPGTAGYTHQQGMWF